MIDNQLSRALQSSSDPVALGWDIGIVMSRAKWVAHENRWEATATTTGGPPALLPQTRYGRSPLEAQNKAGAAVFEAYAKTLRERAAEALAETS